MVKKNGLKIIPVILISVAALFGGYFLGSYLGINDVSEMLVGLSSPEVAQSKAAYSEYNKASSVIVQKKKEIQSIDRQKKQIDEEIKKIQAGAQTTRTKKKIEDLRKKKDELQASRVKKEGEIKKAQAKQTEAIKKISESQKQMTVKTSTAVKQ